MNQRISGIVLAAGLSRRMGYPKALLRWESETYLDRLIRIFSGVCDEVVVVLRPGADALLTDCVRLANARIAWNPDADRGQFSSLQSGLSVATGAVTLFTPVDYGHVQEATVQTIVAAFSPGQDEVLQPEFRGKHGHPVLAGVAATQALRDEPANRQARDVLYRFRRRFVTVTDPGTVMDADDPAAYAAIQETAR